MQSASSGNKVCKAVYPIAEKAAKHLGLEIWDIKFLKEGPNWYLRVFIDSDSGITIDDCENMSKAMDAPLEEADPITQSYFLEVCSPGIDRELITDSHFKKFMGYDIKIRLVRPDENGNKEITGKLASFDKDFITIQNEKSDTTSVNKENISHVNLKY